MQDDNNPIQNTDIINYYNPIILKGDIEEGFGECGPCNAYISRFQNPNICKSNYFVFELISNMSNMSYNIMKSMKQIVNNQVHYFKKKMENYL
jgi:hypothetical protein